MALGRLSAGAPRAALGLGAGIRRRPLHARHGDLDVEPRAEPRQAPPLPVDGRPRRARGGPVGRAGQVRHADAASSMRSCRARRCPSRTSSTGRAIPTVAVPADSYAYPAGAWSRQTADSWPPAKVADATYRLGADGSATQGSASSGVTYLSPLTEDERNDPVAAAALSGTPLGTSPLSSVPATDLPGFIASFRTPPFSTEKELSGTPSANLSWTPAAHRLAAGARAVRRGAGREAHAVQPRRSRTARRAARASSGRCASTATRSASGFRRATGCAPG